MSPKLLKLENVVKHFGERRVIDNFSLDIKVGKITSLIGPNGSGKSTLFDIITGILKADKGKIIFNGNIITGLEPQIVSGFGVSLLFQRPRLFENLTVRENLLLVLNNQDMNFWKNLLGLYKITKKSELLIRKKVKEMNLENSLNLTAKELSYGQKRIVELLRCIVKPHILLLLDEPLSGLSSELRNNVFEMLKRLRNQGETIFLAEHDMNFVFDISDEIVILDEGKIVVKGKPHKIRKNMEIRHSYLK